MNPTASHLVRRVLGWQAAFTLLGALLVALLAPRLLLLRGQVAIEGAASLGSGVLVGGVVATLITGARLWRYRFLLRALAVGSRAVEAHQLHELGEEPRRAIVSWLVPSGLGAAVATLPFAPRTIDPTTAVTLCLLLPFVLPVEYSARSVSVALVITALAGIPDAACDTLNL